jgi:fimbrial isopeptide formation D2 family protein/LPXTG-motif cell wall-anchored protein
MKRFTAILLVVILAFSLSVSSFADTTSGSDAIGSITIADNTNGAKVAGKTFYAYRLFDMTAQDTGMDGTYDIYAGYSFADTWVLNFFKTLDSSITTAAEAATYLGTHSTNNEMQAFAESARTYISTNSVDYTGSATAGDVTFITIDDIPIGYYLVIDADVTSTTTVSACMVSYTTPDVTINIKADNIPDFKKQLGNADVDEVYANVGRTLNFNLLSKEPDTTYYKGYIMKFSDTMSNGLTFNANSLQVTIGSSVYVLNSGSFYASTDTTYSTPMTHIIDYNALTNGFEVQLTLKADYVTTDIYLKDAAVRIDYSATINEAAVAGTTDQNSATLTYTRNPAGDTSITPPDIIKVYTVQIDVTKVDATNTPITTDSATFELYGPNTEKAIPDGATIIKDSDTFYYYGTYDTNNNGTLAIVDLAPGTYYLREIKAPDGYNLLADDIAIVITAGTDAGTEGEITFTVNGIQGTSASIGHATLSVENTTGVELPSTGGIGTTMFTIGGLAILFLAGAFLVVNRKKIFGK